MDKIFWTLVWLVSWPWRVVLGLVCWDMDNSQAEMSFWNQADPETRKIQKSHRLAKCHALRWGRRLRYLQLTRKHR